MKEYKVGDRIFYEFSDGSIESDIVIDIKDDFYFDEHNKEIHYQWLTTWRDGNCSTGIESYNCLAPDNPKCKELFKKYRKFDKQKDSIISSIMDILSPWETMIQKDIIKLLETKINETALSI